jgi:hypothetical protein
LASIPFHGARTRTSAARSATFRLATPFAPITPRVERSDAARHLRPS